MHLRFHSRGHIWISRILGTVLLVTMVGCAGTQRVAGPSGENETAAVELPPTWVISPPPAYEAAIAKVTRSQTGEPGANYWIQKAEYDLTVRVIPEARRLKGHGEIVYHNNSPDALKELYLELIQNIHKEGAVRHEFVEITGGVELQRISLNGTEVAGPGASGGGATARAASQSDGARYAVTGTNLTIYPAAPVEPGQTVRIGVEWAFDIPQKGAGARMGHHGDNLAYIGYWYPVMSVYDDVHGWFTEQFTGTTEFYADFADYRVTVEAPEGWIVWATGELQNPEEVLAPDVLERLRAAHQSDEPMRVVGPDQFGAATLSSDDGMLQWSFTADHVRDFAFTLTRESIWDAARTPVGDRDGDGQTDYVQINTFYRETAPRWANVTAYQQHVIRFLSQHTGYPYPWPHMTAVEGGGIIGGGMEYPMMTLMGDYNQAGDTALYNVTAHELAHMWIPMIVNNNERRFSWMDEGFTTFNENDSRMDHYPGQLHYIPDQRYYAAIAAQQLEGEMMRPSSYHASTTAFGIASYMKPASVLVALRGVLGEETFAEAYHTFVDEWAYRHPYPWDLFNTFERVAGEDLDWFWRTWYYETWTLDQAIADVREVGNETVITIRNEGLAAMPVLLEIELENGDTVERRIPVERWLSGADTAEVRLNAGSPVVRVSIDPNNLFPDIDLADNDWRRGDAAP